MPSIARQITSFKTKEVSETFKKSKIRIREQGLTIIISPKSPKKDFGRILIITPKKAGTAPKRNLIRRRLKSIFYEEKLFKLNHDFIAIITRQSIDLTFSDLKKILMKAIVELN